MDRRDLARILLAGVALGITAGAVVWFLERFEIEKLHHEVNEYLDRQDQFRAWLADHGQAPGAPTDLA